MSSPYTVRGDIGAYEVVDSRNGRIAHTFKFHPDAESCRDSMNEWVRQEQPDDAQVNLDGFDKPGTVFKIGGRVVSREEGLAAFKAALNRGVKHGT